MGFNYAVVGATGNVGREILQILAERSVPPSEVVAIASSASKGIEVAYGDDAVLKVDSLENFDFSTVDIVLSSPGANVSREFAPKAAAAGAIVIDNTSEFRMDPEVPLVVPEVNAEALANYKAKNIIANPNCSTIQMVVALKPLHDEVGVNRVVVSTYQSVSGAGKSAMDELFNQTRGIYANEPEQKFMENFTKSIAFNVIPHIDVFMEDGSTKEEWKMSVETKKIIDPSIEVHANCVRVPVFIGHAEWVNVELNAPLSYEDAKELLGAAPGLVVLDHRQDEGYVTPAECAGEDAVYVSRIREDVTIENGLSFWVVSDNIRKGAALNTVQISKVLIDEHLS